MVAWTLGRASLLGGQKMSGKWRWADGAARGAAVLALTALVGCGSDDEPKGVAIPISHSGTGKLDTYVWVTSSEWNILMFFANGLGTLDVVSGVAPDHIMGPHTMGRVSRTRGAAARAANDTIEITATISGPPSGTNFQYLIYETFDAAGNLWISASNPQLQGSVIEYTVAQQQTGGAIAPAVAVSGTLQAPEGLAFDAAGNLWVADNETGTVIQYTAAQLAASGSPTPAITISIAGLTAGDYSPLGVAIDPQGNIWISALAVNRPPGVGQDSVPALEIAEYAASTVTSSGTPAPAIVLNPHTSGGYGPGLAFDAAGNLWTANTDAGGTPGVTEFAAGTLTPGANPAPAITITNSNFKGVSDVSFDSTGAMFVGTSFSIYVYSPAQLTTTGSPTPVITYTPASGVNNLAAQR